VLFYLPVTKAWLIQLVLGLVLICHSSYRGVIQLLAALFDTPIGLGTVHNLLATAASQAAWFKNGLFWVTKTIEYLPSFI
jgi:hypothetical protein